MSVRYELKGRFFLYLFLKVEKIVGEGSFGKALLCKRKKDRKRCIIKEIALGHLSSKDAKQTQQEAGLLG
jgi:serine/threonine protein kinase